MDWKIAGGLVTFALFVAVVAYGVHLQRAQPALTVCAPNLDAPHLVVRPHDAPNVTSARYAIWADNPTDANVTLHPASFATRILVEVPGGGLRLVSDSTADVRVVDPNGTVLPRKTTIEWIHDEGFVPGAAGVYDVEVTMAGLCGAGRIVVA